MPHTPPPPADWIDPREAADDHPAVRDWQAQIAAGHIGTPPARNPTQTAIHAANTALVARRRRDTRA